MKHICILLGLLPALGACRPLQVPSPDVIISLQGSRPLDTDGNEVHAHGGQLLEDGGLIYWVGTSQKQGAEHDWTSTHISTYSSPDLVHWKNEGVAFHCDQIKGFPGDLLPYGHLDHPPPPYRIERPKILHNARQGRYVLMFHLDTPAFEVPSVGVATSPNITGPYTWVHHIFPDNNTSYDMTVWHEPDTDGAYLVRSCPVMTISVSRLRPDWLDTEGTVCSLAHGGEEAPAVFRHRGRHYIFTSHLTGWNPNPPLLHKSEAGGMCDTTWPVLPTPVHGPKANTTYDAQSTFVFTYTFPEDGTQLLLWMGDRWQPNGIGSVGNASYVWLPLLPHSEGPGFELVWVENWSLRQFKGAMWDMARRRVRFAPNAAGAAAVS